MAKSAVLNVSVLVDAAQAAAGLDQVADRAESAGSKLAKIGGAVAAAGIVAFAAKAVEAASSLEDAMGSVDSVFKDNADQVHAWAADTTDSIRLPQSEFEAYAASMGSMLKNAGVPMDQLADKTKELMQLSADLSAQSGQTASVGVEAMKAALKGEYEQLENLNVSITAAQVSTEALKIAQGDAAKAADPLVRQQAALNLIYQQSGDALGAAERESKNFASQQDHLNEVMTNFLAAVGAPLLAGISGMIDGFTNIVPLVLPLATGLAELVGWVLQLPTPLLAAAAGLAAWQIVGGLAGITATFTAAITKLTVALKALQTSTIVGAALLAVVTAIAFFSDAMNSADESIQQTNDTYAKWLGTLQDGKVTENTRDTIALDGATSGLFDTYEKLGVSTQAYVDASTGVEGGQAALAASVQKATNALFQQGGVFGDIAADAAKATIAQDELVEAAASGDWAGVTAKMQAYADQQSALTGNSQVGIDMMSRFTAALAAGKDPATALADATDLAAQTADKFGVSAADADQAARAMGEGEEDAAAAAARLADELKKAQTAAGQTVGASLLRQAKDEADIAARAVDIVRVAVEQLDQRLSNEEAVANWSRGFQDGLSGIQKLRAEAEEAGKANPFDVEALKTWNVALLQTGAANQEIYDTLSGQAAIYPELIGQTFASAMASSTAADEAGKVADAVGQTQGAANQARIDFIALAESAGLTSEEAGALATKLGILDATQISPKLFEILAQDAAAQAVVLRIQQEQIGAKNFEITAGIDGAIGTTDDLITYVNAAGEAMPPVPITGDAAPAEGEADAFTGQQRTTEQVAIVANSAPARNAMEAFRSDYSKIIITATANANTAPARNAMEAFRSDYAAMNLTATILGNSAPARQAIQALTSGSYSATVQILADTSRWLAAFNSLPSSRTVTIVTQGAPALAAAPSLASASAPTLRGGKAASAGAPLRAGDGSTTVINVSGGLDSGDQIARRIKRVILGRDRRSGGVVVGEMRARVGHS